MIADFHFVRPWWLLGLIPVLLLLWRLWRNSRNSSGWRAVVAPHLLQLLGDGQHQRRSSWRHWVLGISLLLSTLALAGPAWERLPQPVYQLKAGYVVVMDMSMSMRATDIQPNRVSQQRFKAIDLVQRYLDGEVGLIAYAGDAFLISPLSTDGNNLANLIRALSPEIMPVMGSNPYAALTLADSLLTEAGYAAGDIIWFTDGIDASDQRLMNEYLRNKQHRLSIMAVGTPAGAPIELSDGRYLRDATGQVVIPTYSQAILEDIARRQQGNFVQFRNDEQDLISLTNLPELSLDGEASDAEAGDQWADRGAWLILPLLLLALLVARKGALPRLVPMLVVCSSLLLSNNLYAQQRAAEAPAETADESALAWYQQLWQTPYQQASAAIASNDYQRAQAISEDAWQRATANYRAGNYEAALVDFSQRVDAEGFFNQGNALMQLERYQEAIKAYQEALSQRPNWVEASENKALAEQLLEQQQQQQQQQPQQNGEQQQQDSSEQQNDGEGEGEQQQDSEQQQQEQQESEQNSEQQAEQEAEQNNEDSEEAAQEGETEQAETQMNGEFSEEQRQQMEQWLNRIQDDPAVLLRNKMRREAQLRQQQNRLPRGVQKEW